MLGTIDCSKVIGIALPTDSFGVKRGPRILGPTPNRMQTASGPRGTGWRWNGKVHLVAKHYGVAG